MGVRLGPLLVGMADQPTINYMRMLRFVLGHRLLLRAVRVDDTADVGANHVEQHDSCD
jgi:hypothetical protein